jgi:hypothetical protein
MALVLVLMFTNLGSKILHQIRLGSSNSTSLSDYQRSQAASAAWDQIKARPIEGVGFSVIANAHDIYLELLDAGGLIVLTSFLVFCGGIAAAVRRGMLGAQREEAIGLGVAALVWLANGVFDNQVADKYLYVVPGLLLAVAGSVAASRTVAATRGTTQIDQAWTSPREWGQDGSPSDDYPPRPGHDAQVWSISPVPTPTGIRSRV